MSETVINFNNIHSFELDDHLVLLKKNASSVQILNPLAKLIWQFKKDGISNQHIAEEISNAFSIPIELAQQDIKSINAQWLLDLSTSNEKSLQKEPLPFNKHLRSSQGENCIFFAFPRINIKLTLDSTVIAEKIRKILSHAYVSKVTSIDLQLDIFYEENHYIIVKDNQILEQCETENQTTLMVFHHIVDFVCKQENWLTILHSAGVSWQGSGIIFPALGGSGKTTLAAALLKNGFEYINDDVIPLIRQTGELIPLPTNLSIKSGSWMLLKPFYPELEDLEVFGTPERKVKYLPPPSCNFSSSLYARCIILPNYQTGASAELEQLTAVSALQAIIEGESLLRLPLEKDDIAGLIEWLKPLSCYRITYDDLDPAVKLLRQFCINNF